MKRQHVTKLNLDEDAYLDYLEEIEESEEEEQEVDDVTDDTAVVDDEDPLRAADAAAQVDDEADPEVDDELPPAEPKESEADPEAEDESEPEADLDAAPDTTSGEPTDNTRTAIRYAEGTVEEVDQKLSEIDTKLEDVETRRDDLVAKWEDGDLERDEFNKQKAALRAEERAIAKEERALNSQRDNIQRTDREIQHYWKLDTAAFFRENPDYAKSALLQGALSASITAVAGEEGWLEKGNMAILAEARKRTDEELGRAAAAPAADKEEEAKPELTAAEKEKAKADAAKARKEKKPIPKTLADAPPAAEPVIGKDKLAAIDDLEGEEYEAAYASLSAADKDRYLKATH